MKTTKKLVITSLIFTLLLHYTIIFALAQPEDLSAKSSALISAESGQVLLENNANEQSPPGGLAKILTAIVALNKSDADDTITVPDNVSQYITSSDPTMKLKPGEKIQLKSLISGMLIGNANDAAIVIALHVSGSIEDFATLMNEHSRNLGCENSNFVNPTGNKAQDQYTTALDMARIFRRAIEMNFLSSVLKLSSIEIPATDLSPVRNYTSNNHLIHTQTESKYFYEAAQGGKTGSIDGFGYNLASVAEKDGISLICVALGSGGSSSDIQSFSDSKKIFEYGFENFIRSTTIVKNTPVGEIAVEKSLTGKIPLNADDSFSFLIKKTDSPTDIQKVLDVPDKLTAPIEAGKEVGRLNFEYEGNTIGSVKVVAAQDAPVSGSALNIAVIFISFLVIIYIFVIIFKSFKN